MFKSFLVISIFMFASCTPLTPLNSHSTIKKKYGAKKYGSQFIKINDKDVHYRVSGSGPALVLIPGTIDTLHTYELILPHLIKNFKVIQVDLPGFGLSENILSPKMNNRFIKVINAHLNKFLSKIGVHKYHLLGNSLGGLVAWTHAIDFPNHVDKLILLDPAAFKQKLPWFFDVSHPYTKEVISLFGGVVPLNIAVDIFLELQPGLLGPMKDKRFKYKQGRRIVDIFQTLKNVKSYVQILEQLSLYDFLESSRLHELRSKDVFLIYGENDSIVPVKDHIPLWLQALPDVYVWERKGGGHLPHWEDPDLLSDRITKFLRK